MVYNLCRSIKDSLMHPPTVSNYIELIRFLTSIMPSSGIHVRFSPIYSLTNLFSATAVIPNHVFGVAT